MDNDFKALVAFLERLGPEAEGRQVFEPDAKVAAQLERFARGECGEIERTEICRILQLNPAWLGWLAERVKRQRQSRKTGAAGI